MMTCAKDRRCSTRLSVHAALSPALLRRPSCACDRGSSLKSHRRLRAHQLSRPSNSPLTHPITIAPTIHLLPHRLSAFLRDGVKAPLALGDVLLADGSLEKGFVGESYGVASAPDISAHGGWRGFLQAQQQQEQQQQ